MLQIRQKNLKVFVCSQGEDKEIIEYLNKNSIFLQGFLLVFTYILSEELRNFLCSKEINFFEQSYKKGLILRDLKNNKDFSPIQKVEKNSLQKVVNTLVIHRTIRSGEEVKSEGDITIFGRINSGALIQSQGNIQIFGEVNGNISCNGEYLIITSLQQGNIVFGGEIIQKQRLGDGAKRIYKKNNEIIIEDL
ncbi:septum site-determining protein MinC [Helicobacter mesocricetorum]|uniref:septum site-determining protein MinC n=1 Tax=Helicobacter mesocricetorum TaxID=87012 RepID=UPI000CF0CEF5|nr:septum site-determining protein MinC [Helicobacter mesocricetorum]